MFDTLKRKIRVFATRPLWQKRAALGVLGAVGGFAYYHFVGCASGACPISGNPYISTAYGALAGALLPVEKRPPETARKGNSV